MEITRDFLFKIAKLAQLEIPECEEGWYIQELQSFLNYVDLLKKFEPNTDISMHDNSDTNCFRSDILVETSLIDQVLLQAPQTEESMFIVPRVLSSE